MTSTTPSIPPTTYGTMLPASVCSWAAENIPKKKPMMNPNSSSKESTVNHTCFQIDFVQIFLQWFEVLQNGISADIMFAG